MFSKNENYIIKGISGFYYVKTADGVLECKVRGIFRKKGITPVAGDYVELTYEKDNTPVIENIKKRKNLLQRPPIANIDQLFIVISTVDPSPDFLLTDKLTAIAIENNIQPFIIVTKSDLFAADSVKEHYKNSKISLLVSGEECNDFLKMMADLLKGKLSVFTGNSGVGKSTLLNYLSNNQLQLETNEISDKLGRGKHTTRAVEIYELLGGLVADTPGFSALEFEKSNHILKENLQYDFPEFEEYIHECKFNNCMHINEKGCAVKDAVAENLISQGRYRSYVQMYDEAKELKEWEL